MTRITQVFLGNTDTLYMETKYTRSESTANQQMLAAAKRTNAQTEAALVAAIERAEILRKLGV